MLARRRGKIINVCSVQSELARPNIAPYAATKGALKLLTQGMCADWAPYGITVNGIGPGYFATELTQALRDDAEFDAWIRGARRRGGGASPRSSSAPRSSSPRRRRTSSTGRSSTSTAASWP